MQTAPHHIAPAETLRSVSPAFAFFIPRPVFRGPCLPPPPPPLFLHVRYVQVMGEKGMLSLGNPPSSGLELLDSQGCSTSPPEHSFPQRFREVCIVGHCPGTGWNVVLRLASLSLVC